MKVNNTLIVLFIHFFQQNYVVLAKTSTPVLWRHTVVFPRHDLLQGFSDPEFQSKRKELVRLYKHLGDQSGKSTRSFFVWSCGWLEQYVFCCDKIFLNIFCCCFPPLVGVITCMWCVFFVVFRDGKLSHFRQRRHMARLVTRWNQAQWSKAVQCGATEALPLRAVTCDEMDLTWTNLSSTDTNLTFSL